MRWTPLQLALLRMDDEDALFGEAAKKLDLERLAAGYPD